MSRPAFTLSELGNTYAESGNRYIVSLIVGYDDHEATSPAAAVAHTLKLTRDADADGTHWYVYDRHTRSLHLVTQRQAEDLMDAIEDEEIAEEDADADD